MPFSELEIVVPKYGHIKPPTTLITLGDHIRKKRIESWLMQKEVAEILNVCEDTITGWETGRSDPQTKHLGNIIKFLGYMPFEIDTSTLGGKIKFYRYTTGTTTKAFAELFEVHPATVNTWENNLQKPNSKIKQQIIDLISKKPSL